MYTKQCCCVRSQRIAVFEGCDATLPVSWQLRFQSETESLLFALPCFSHHRSNNELECCCASGWRAVQKFVTGPRVEPKRRRTPQSRFKLQQ